MDKERVDSKGKKTSTKVRNKCIRSFNDSSEKPKDMSQKDIKWVCSRDGRKIVISR